MLNNLLPKSVTEAKLYQLGVDTSIENSIRLHQNEMCQDWHYDLKKKVCEELLKNSWNYYQKPFAIDQENVLADYHQLEPGSILLIKGAALAVDLLFTWLGKTGSYKWIIPTPCFSQYTLRSAIHNVNHEFWPLDKNLNYDIKKLEKKIISHNSQCIVLFDSPNNPTGALIKFNQLKNLLISFPKVAFICDAAYSDFSQVDYTPLLLHHKNLIILKTLSKGYSCAALRIGYILSSKDFITNLRKTIMPYTLNPLDLIALKYITNDDFLQRKSSQISQTNKNTNKLFKSLTKLKNKYFLATNNNDIIFNVYPSYGNYLLLTFDKKSSRDFITKKLFAQKILTRSFEKCANMNYAIRVTTGSDNNNSLFLEVLEDSLRHLTHNI